VKSKSLKAFGEKLNVAGYFQELYKGQNDGDESSLTELVRMRRRDKNLIKQTRQKGTTSTGVCRFITVTGHRYG